MSDDLVKSMEDDLRIGCSASIGDTQKAVAALKNQAAEITRLRAERNAEISARMKAEGEFSTMQRRIARQRRALTKLYQRRHDKNAALATARREGMETALRLVRHYEAVAYQHGDLPYMDPHECAAQAAREIAAAIRAAAKEGKP